MSLQEETDTFEGQVYRDEMMECYVEVTAADNDIGVMIRDVELLDEDGRDGGNPYPWPDWKEAKESDRFVLRHDPRDVSEGDEGTESEEEVEESTTEQEVEETIEQASEESEGGMGPDEFSHQDPLSW